MQKYNFCTPPKTFRSVEIGSVCLMIP
jgi:hypothetical protein